MTIARRRQKAKIIGRPTGRGLGLEIDSKDDNADGLTSFLVRGQTDRSRSVCLVNPSPIGEQSIVMSVSVCPCLSVCDHIFGTSRPIFTNFLCVLPMAVARSSSGGVMTLRTSGFMDDVIFAYKPRLLDVAAHLKRSAHAALGSAINCAQ